MTTKPVLRRRNHKDRDLGELARDTEAALSALVRLEVRTITAQYREPMFLAADHEPACILLGRVRQVGALETPVQHGARVSFTWLGAKGIRIDDIDAMVAGATKHEFTFLLLG